MMTIATGKYIETEAKMRFVNNFNTYVHVYLVSLVNSLEIRGLAAC